MVSGRCWYKVEQEFVVIVLERVRPGNTYEEGDRPSKSKERKKLSMLSQIYTERGPSEGTDVLDLSQMNYNRKYGRPKRKFRESC